MTIINNARGEDMHPVKDIFGPDLDAQRDLLLFFVEAEKSAAILEPVAAMGRFDDAPGTGIAGQLDVENAFGPRTLLGEPQPDAADADRP